MELLFTINSLLIKDIKRRLSGESVPRIKKCLDQLTHKEIWRRPNQESNSIGNLVLHLCGNARQYILSGIGNQLDKRNRSIEFQFNEIMDKAILYQMLDDLMTDVNLVLDGIRPDQLVEIKQVQCFEESVVSILIHVVEHFSYHTGQIVYYTKYLKNIDLKFYDGLDLDRISNT